MYHSPNLVSVISSRGLIWAVHVVKKEEGRIAFKMLTGKPTGVRPLGRPRHIREDNNRMHHKEIDIDTRKLVDSAQNTDYWRALENVALNLQVP